MNYGIKAKDVMTRRPVTISENSNLYEAAKKMLLHDVGSLLIVDDKNFLKGLVTEKTFMREVVVNGKDPKKTKIKSVMTKDLITAVEDSDIFEIIQLMKKHNIRRIPIVEDGKLKGIITQKDIIAVAPGLIDMIFEISSLREPDLKLKIRTSERAGVCEICGNFSNRLKLINGRWICPTCEAEIYGRD